MTPSDQDQVYENLKTQTEQLNEAIDTRVKFELNGDVTFGPCGPLECTVIASVSNTVTAKAMQSAQIHAEMTVTMTGDGAPVGGCTADSDLPPDASAELSCVNTDPAWESFYARATAPSETSTVHPYVAIAEVVARAIVTADIVELESELEQEQQREKEDRKPPGSNQEDPCPETGKPWPPRQINGLPVFCVYQSRTAMIYLNDSSAQAAGYPSILHYEPTMKDTRRSQALSGPSAPKTCVSGQTRDEYPFATTLEAGLFGGRYAQVRCVPGDEQSRQGGDVSAFYGTALHGTPGAAFLVLPVPW
jgi:hypothetical protein